MEMKEKWDWFWKRGLELTRMAWIKVSNEIKPRYHIHNLTNVARSNAWVWVSFTTPGSSNLFSTSVGHEKISVSTSETCAGPGDTGDSMVIMTGLTAFEFGGVMDDKLSGIRLRRLCIELLGRSLVRMSSDTMSSAVWKIKETSERWLKNIHVPVKTRIMLNTIPAR